MDKREEIEDEEFKKKWLMAEKGVDYFQMAHVLSGRLRQMERRAKAANKRADNAEFSLSQARFQAYEDSKEVISSLCDKLDAIEMGARNLDAYLKWQLSEGSPGYAPTFPSGVAYFRGQFDDWVFAPGSSRFEQNQIDRRYQAIRQHSQKGE